MGVGKIYRLVGERMTANQFAKASADEYPPTIRVKSLAAPVSDQKRLGAYYTPENLSRVLTDWAVQQPTDRILEPSFGKCGFLSAAQRRLLELGCPAPRTQIFGCDVDAGAFKFLAEVLGQPIDTKQFLQLDFLDIESGRDWPHQYACVIGNPPYIPFQAIPNERRQEQVRRCKRQGISVSSRASLWAYFLVHATSFISEGGRMAWVLPGAFLQADYAKGIRDYLSCSFGSVLCVLMHQRFFKNEGTEEETVVLLAKGRRPIGIPTEILFADAESLEELSTTIATWDAGNEWEGRILNARPSYLATDQQVVRLFENVVAHPGCHTLGDFVLANIGLVTGANDFFILSNESKARLRLGDDDTVRVLGKFKAARGLTFTIKDHEEFLDTGAKGHMVHVEKLPLQNTALRRYLDSFPISQRTKIGTFKKRATWHAPEDGNIPDAFLPVMNHGGPRLVLNKAKMNCTNTLHRAFFRMKLSSVHQKLLAISLLTSFSQLSAEFVGRRYGSGVLKHEPREIEKIAVLMPLVQAADVNAAFKNINKLLRAGKSIEAMAKADELVLGTLNNWQDLSAAFVQALQDARTLRCTTRYLSGA